MCLVIDRVKDFRSTLSPNSYKKASKRSVARQRSATQSISCNNVIEDWGKKSAFEACEKGEKEKLLIKLASYQTINDPEITSPSSETLKVVEEIIDMLPLSEILQPSLMIDPDGEISLYWQTEQYYGELGADNECSCYFLLNNRKAKRNLPSKSIDGNFNDIKAKVLKEIKRKFGNDSGGTGA